MDNEYILFLAAVDDTAPVFIPFILVELNIDIEFAFQVHIQWTIDISFETEIFEWEFTGFEMIELVDGPNSDAVCLAGAPQFIRIEADADQCFGNWESCSESGVTFSTSVKLSAVEEDMFILSSGAENGDSGFALFYSFGEYHVSVLLDQVHN